MFVKLLPLASLVLALMLWHVKARPLVSEAE